MPEGIFEDFFIGSAREHLLRSIKDALDEDGADLTTNAVFAQEDRATACIVAKEPSIVAGLPIAPLILAETAKIEAGEWQFKILFGDGSFVENGAVVAEIAGSTRILLRAERIILNFLTHLSGIANLTSRYVRALAGTGVRLLDTRKTLPGLRYPEKYAVIAGGGFNHRKNLGELLMLKDNHVDAAGGVSNAVNCLRQTYNPAPPIEVECRNISEVREAVGLSVFRIMLDNMDPVNLREALDLIPQSIEIEISGGVNLESIRSLAEIGNKRKADYISVGRLTHSAPTADFSLLMR